MATERMYDLAFQYKKTKLWKKLYDTEVFAVRLSDGETGYCCVMGMAGELNAVALYVGEEGFQSYRNIAGPPPSGITSEFGYQELLLSQDCLQCAFDSKDALSGDEIEEVRAYAKAHGITLRGANAFPQFIKYQPNRHPWGIGKDTDQRRICEALEACLALSELLQGAHKRELGISELLLEPKTMPMLVREDGRYAVTQIGVPPEIPAEHPAPQAANDILTARIKKRKKKGVLECEVIRLLEPVQEDENEAPYYPVILLAVDRESEWILPPKPVLYFEEHPEALLEAFEESLLEHEVCPRAIDVSDARTFALLRDLCQRTGIRLRVAEEELPALEDARDSLMSAMFPDDGDWDGSEEEFEDAMTAQVFDMLMSLSDSDLKQMPGEMRNQLLQLADAGMLPPEVEARLRRVFKK